MAKKRVLALHGYHGSADLVQFQLRPLFEPFADRFEFVAFDAPSIAAAPTTSCRRRTRAGS